MRRDRRQPGGVPSGGFAKEFVPSVPPATATPPVAAVTASAAKSSVSGSRSRRPTSAAPCGRLQLPLEGVPGDACPPIADRSETSTCLTLAQVLPGIRLHPVHGEPSSSNTFSPVSSTDLCSIFAGTSNQKSGTGKKFRVGINGAGSGASLVIFKEQKTAQESRHTLMEVPLFLSDLQRPRGQPLVAISCAMVAEEPSPSSASNTLLPPASSTSLPPSITKSKRRSSDASSYFLLLAEGGEDSLQRALSTLAAAGAVRSDFDETIQTDKEVLGMGGFGVIRRAKMKNPMGEDKSRIVVVKSIAPEDSFTRRVSPGQVRQVISAAVSMQVRQVISAAVSMQDCSIPKAVRTEFQFLLAAQKHPNVIDVYSLFRDPAGGFALVMDFCGGGDLFQLVSKVGILGEAACSDFVEGLMKALGHLHSLEILHRDVKPENALLHLDGRVVLADFGLACHASDTEEARRRIGSPGFIAPEVLRGSKATGKVDVFAAGATLFFALAGISPFNSKDMVSTLQKTLNEHVSLDDKDCFKNLSSDCRNFVLLLLSKKHETRPTSTEALLHSWLGGKKGSSASQSTSQTASRISKKSSRGSVSQGATTSRPSFGGRRFVAADLNISGDTGWHRQISAPPLKPPTLTPRMSGLPRKQATSLTPSPPLSKELQREQREELQGG